MYFWKQFKINFIKNKTKHETALAREFAEAIINDKNEKISIMDLL